MTTQRGPGRTPTRQASPGTRPKSRAAVLPERAPRWLRSPSWCSRSWGPGPCWSAARRVGSPDASDVDRGPEAKELSQMPPPRNPRSAGAVEAFTEIMGRRHVLTSARATAPYTTGDRFGGGEVLAVLRPGSLVDMWRALQVCVDHDLIVITQAANTGLTGGSGPGDQDYDRDIVIISTLRIDQIHLLHDAREAVCLPGATLFALEEKLAPHGREPHSVIGSTSIGASVVGGIANNSGGSQIRKGPAYTEQAIFARVDEHGQIHLVNLPGIDLGTDPTHIRVRRQRGDWHPAGVTPPPPDSTETAYAEHVRQLVDSPARFNADPTFHHEASGSAGKIMVFAVRKIGRASGREGGEDRVVGG